MGSAITAFDVNARRVGDRAVVTFAAGAKWRAELDAESAEKLARAIIRTAQRRPHSIDLPRAWRVVGTRRTVPGGQEKPQVLIGAPNGRHVEVDLAPAQHVGAALLSRAQAAAEFNEAQRLAEDQALILRLDGLPVGGGARLRIGLTDHPRILDEAAKLAATDETLRRFLPGGVKAQMHFPLPGVHHTTMPAGPGRLDPTKIVRTDGSE